MRNGARVGLACGRREKESADAAEREVSFFLVAAVESGLLRDPRAQALLLKFYGLGAQEELPSHLFKIAQRLVLHWELEPIGPS